MSAWYKGTAFWTRQHSTKVRNAAGAEYVPVSKVEWHLTNVNVLEKISGRRRLEAGPALVFPTSLSVLSLAELLPPGWTGWSRQNTTSWLSWLGSGKTTFLKHVALQCSSGELQVVPLFITLKDFAETQQQPSLLEYITEQLSLEAERYHSRWIVKPGSDAPLLDGLDEVKNR